ncbi:MAG: hypothetical protein A2Y07_07480 [Planctomycetes bacterium GWF2_50_10]|nr:MAG: hypothetical protein A2Y07_07480 [Planctomycetes bacterium GWF2_50_10]
MIKYLSPRFAVISCVVLIFPLVLAGQGLGKSVAKRAVLNFPDCNSVGNSFTFALAGDSRGHYKQVNKDVLGPVMDNIQKQVNSAFTVFVGDLIHGSYLDSGLVARAMAQWQDVISTHYSGAVVTIPGNHDAKTKKSQELYKKFFGTAVPQNGPEDEKGLTYYFDFKGCRFVMLDTNVHGDSGKVRHIDWLEKVLKSAREQGNNHILVFGHVPAWPVIGGSKEGGEDGEKAGMEGTDKFWELLKTYGVSAYFCGHEHVYARAKVTGVWQVIAGGAGAPLTMMRKDYKDATAAIRSRTNHPGAKTYNVSLAAADDPHIPSDKASHLFGDSIYNYVMVDVSPAKIRVRMYGAKQNDSPMKFELMDQFDIR